MHNKYMKYLGLRHDYQSINCITLIEKIYTEELGSSIFSSLWAHLNLEKGKPKEGKRWKFNISFENILEWTNKNTQQVKLSEIKEYDVILFKSEKGRPIHFGMYVGENNFIHVEESAVSVISPLNQVWRDKIHSIYRR